MSPEIYATFEQLIAQQRKFSSVLEIGAQSNQWDLIRIPALQNTSKKFAIISYLIFYELNRTLYILILV